jgi:hypothetical protein
MNHGWKTTGWKTIGWKSALRIGMLLLCALLALPALPAITNGSIDKNQYQVPMDRAPESVADAIASLPQRRDTVLAAVACGAELNFISMFRTRSNGEDMGSAILGKLAWIQHSGRFANPAVASIDHPCEFSIVGRNTSLCGLFDDNCNSDDSSVSKPAATAFLNNPAWTQIVAGPALDTTLLRGRMLSFLPPACAITNADGVARFALTAAIRAPDPDDPPAAPPTLRLTFRINSVCLAAEVDAALLEISRGDKQVGSSGAPCNYVGVTEGDWDATLKGLMRIAELDRRHPVLGADARKYLNETLIDIDGGPAQQSYHFWECGNEEQSTGDPATRSDDRDGVDSMLDDIWDSGWSWLAFLAVLLLIILLIAALAIAGATLLAAAMTAAVVIGAATLLLTIPETENHLWMINSTQYLNNQYLITNGATGYWDDQNDLREWILKHLQTTAQNDFLEYNSRPYQRYSLSAIVNLADFANDPDVRIGARLVLEQAIAKYAVTSNEGRRLAPFRRKREDLPHVDGIPRDGSALTNPDPPHNGLFDLTSGADHMHAIGLYYFGQSLNLPAFDGTPYAATVSGYAPDALYYATSGYLPDDVTFALAIERAAAPLVHQRLHHYGYEIVSSGASFSITAGGHTTGLAQNVTVDPIDKILKPSSMDAAGAAVPTTVMLKGPPDVPPTLATREVTRAIDSRRSMLNQFLRFEGKRPPAVEESPSYDQNLCVWDGFACGVNMMIPDDLKACMTPGARAGWHFIRSDAANCAAYKDGPVFWMALYYKQRLGIDVSGWGLVYSNGFIEIVDSAEMTFDEFKNRVESRNAGAGEPMQIDDGCLGSYVSARGMPGQHLDFSCERVEKVDGIKQPDPDDWPHAGSPPQALGIAPIQSSGSGKIEVTAVGIKRRMVLDFERWDDPAFNIVVLP